MNIKPIKSEADYDAALTAIDGLMGAAPDTPESDKLEVLVTLVEAYEAERWPIEALDPISAIEHVMEARGLRQKDFGALQVAEPPSIRPGVLMGEGDVGERVAALGRCFASELMMHHYHLSTRHVARTPRSDVRPETLASLRSTIEVAIGGQAVPLPGFPNYSLSIRNIWIGAVGWLIEGAERRLMVRCVTAWTVEGAAKGLRWLATELPEELGLPCCLVKLGVPLLEDPGAASWLDDAERCISWALLPTAENRGNQ